MVFRVLGYLISVLVFSAVTMVRAYCAEIAIPDLALGQLWSIKSAEPSSAKIIICGIEAWHGKTVIQVSVVDVRVPLNFPGGAGIITIGHMPFEKSAIEASVDQLITTDALPTPAFKAGYERWRADKAAGIYTIGVGQAIEATLETISHGHSN